MAFKHPPKKHGKFSLNKLGRLSRGPINAKVSWWATPEAQRDPDVFYAHPKSAEERARMAAGTHYYSNGWE